MKEVILATASVVPLVAITNRLQVARVRERKLQEANRAHREFLAALGHDLRTPLTAMLGFAELLQRHPLTPEQAESVAQIVSGGQHALTLLDEVLDITRIEAGQRVLSPERVHLGELVSQVVQLVRPLAARRDLTLVTAEMCGEGVHVQADAQRLRQVLLNLLSNAVKYNRQGGEVVVGCAVVGDRARILVRDTGAGIPSDKLALLFRPFERLGAEQTGIEGTGLGLVLARRLTEAMGGTLGLDTTRGRGSLFWIELKVWGG